MEDTRRVYCLMTMEDTTAGEKQEDKPRNPKDAQRNLYQTIYRKTERDSSYIAK